LLEKILHIATFAVFLIVAGFIGFFLWQSLFVAEKIGDNSNQTAAAQTEQRRANESSQRDATDKAIAKYTKLLAVFTGFLVLATILLFVSGERSIGVARRSATAAKELSAYAPTLRYLVGLCLLVERLSAGPPLGGQQRRHRIRFEGA
jgi:hypothetical protein